MKANEKLVCKTECQDFMCEPYTENVYSNLGGICFQHIFKFSLIFISKFTNTLFIDWFDFITALQTPTFLTKFSFISLKHSLLLALLIEFIRLVNTLVSIDL